LSTAEDRTSSARASAAHKWSIGLGVAALQSLVYFGIGHVPLARSTELLRTRLDDAIPLLPWTAWCYLPFYAAVFIIALASIRSRVLFDRAVRSVVIVMLVGAAGHLLIKAEYPRPTLAPPYPDLSTAFLAFVYRIDRPGNVFPSLHVAHTSMLSMLLIRDRPVVGRVTFVMALMLAVSTLTAKQHFVVDVVAGFLLAIGGRALALRAPRPGPQRLPAPPG
jgi:membrane-associated phospholipid phosphatase